MSSTSENIAATSDNIHVSGDESTANGDLTYVEGVGNIPRDVFRYVKSDPLGDLPRYSIHIVVQHFLTFMTFLVLAATGLTLHFSDLWWAPYMVSLFGGADSARLIHRMMAFLMIGASVYHLATIIGGTLQKLSKKQFDIKRTQIPRLKDLQDIVHDMKYFFGKERYRPKMEKFMYKQKLHYLAILWGSFVLIAAGSSLLFPEVMATVWPNAQFGQDLARLMHADEALMAITVVVFWHWSNVHLVPGRFPLRWTFITGRITREHQIEEHFLEYLNDLKDIPEERDYMKKILKDNGLDTN
jgi:cytochrome b subunit of formate dehydrogenase